MENEHMDGNYLVREHESGARERILISPVPEPPALPTPLNQAQFRKRFTLAEKIAIYEAAPNSALVRVFLDDLAADTDGIHLDDPHTIAGINALQAAGLITAERAAEILTP